MENYILNNLWWVMMLSLHINAVSTNHSTINSSRSKRSFGFGFSNPIFSRVFNPYDDRPLAAKFFGGDYEPQYPSNSWNYNSWSDDDDDCREDYQEEKTHAYGYGGWGKPSDNSGTYPYPAHKNAYQKHKDDHVSEKKPSENTTPKSELNFKSLPLYDIKKPFRTPGDVKKLHDTEKIPNAFKPQNGSVKKPTLEYIFNLLPHYDRRHVFRTPTPSRTILQVIKNNKDQEIIKNIVPNEQGVLSFSKFKWPQGLSYLDHHNDRQGVKPNAIQIVQLPLHDNTHFKLPSYQIEKVFDEKHKGYISPAGVKLTLDKSPSVLEDRRATFVLPNYSIKDIFNDKSNNPKPFTSKPSFLSNQNGGTTTVSSNEDHFSLTLPKFESRLKFDVQKTENDRESKYTTTIIESTTPKIEVVTVPLHEKSKYVDISKTGQLPNRYIPHRTKVVESYSQFLSLPSVVIYERFDNDKNKSLTGKKANIVSRVTEMPRKFLETTTKYLEIKEVPQRHPSEVNNRHSLVSRPSNNLPSQEINQRVQYHKIEPLTKRPTTEFTSPKEPILHLSKISPPNDFSESPINRFQSFDYNTPRNIPESQTHEYLIADTEKIKNRDPKHKTTYFNIGKKPLTWSVLENQINRINTSPSSTEQTVISNRNNFNPNIPQSILESLSQQKKEAPEKPKVKYITQSVIVKPLRGDLQEIPPPSSTHIANEELKFSHEKILPSRNDIQTGPKYEIRGQAQLQQNGVPSPMNSTDPKVLRVHHVRRKPPTSNDFSSTGSYRIWNSTRSRSRPILTLVDNRSSLEPTKTEKINNVSHKRVRTDSKRLPSEKKIDFRTLPHYDNKGTSFRPRIVYEIVGNKNNIDVRREELKQPFISENVDVTNDFGGISIGDIPLEKHRIWDSKKPILVNSYGEDMR